MSFTNRQVVPSIQLLTDFQELRSIAIPFQFAVVPAEHVS